MDVLSSGVGRMDDHFTFTNRLAANRSENAVSFFLEAVFFTTAHKTVFREL